MDQQLYVMQFEVANQYPTSHCNIFIGMPFIGPCMQPFAASSKQRLRTSPRNKTPYHRAIITHHLKRQSCLRKYLRTQRTNYFMISKRFQVNKRFFPYHPPPRLSISNAIIRLLLVVNRIALMQAEDEQFFIPDGYSVFRIKETSLGDLRIRARTLPYPSDASTLQELVDIFMEEYGIRPGQFGAGRAVYLGLHGVGKLWMDVQVFELKSRLNHLSAKRLELLPFLNNKDVFNYECFTSTNFTQNPSYRPPEDRDNTLDICIELPQVHQVYYADLLASGTLKDELQKFLKVNQGRIGKDLSSTPYKAICKGCGEVAGLERKVYQLFQAHFAIELRFDRLEQREEPKPLTLVELEIKQGSEKTLRLVPFVKVVRKKVKTVLEELRVEKAGKLGLRILGLNLRPGDLLSQVESKVVVMSEGRIQAFIIEESELFYSIGPSLMERDFDLQEVAAAFSSHQVRQSKERVINEIFQKRERRIAEISQLQQPRQKPKEHRKKSFLDPLLGYTSQLFYRELNQHLRDTDFGSVPDSLYDRVEYKFSFAIVRSLLMLPGYGGVAYRGVGFYDRMAKVGKVVCFKAFTSSSTSAEKAKHFGTRTFYTIYSVSSRRISDYSYFKTEAEVLFMPYTYFQVMAVTKSRDNPDCLEVTMREIPMPRWRDRNLLMWVDDDVTEGSKICENLLLTYPRLTTEVVQLSSNQDLRVWLEKFGHCISERPKVALITDLKRGEELAAGLETIEALQKVGRGLEVFLYVFNLQPALELLAERRVQLSPSLAIGNTRKEVMQFITEKAVEKEELITDTCQLI